MPTTTISVYNGNGEKVREREVHEKFFLVKPKASVVHQVVVAQMANARRVLADTKDRSEVRGGGRKPWKQKGTGRARHGSSRSPIWRGGGVTFGPTTQRQFAQKVNKKMKQKALFMALSEKVAKGSFVLLETLEIPTSKTKELLKIVSKLPCTDRKTLVALPQKNPLFMRAVRNIKHITAVGMNSLNVIDILRHEYFITTEEGIEEMKRLYKRLQLH